MVLRIVLADPLPPITLLPLLPCPSLKSFSRFHGFQDKVQVLAFLSKVLPALILASLSVLISCFPQHTPVPEPQGTSGELFKPVVEIHSVFSSLLL